MSFAEIFDVWYKIVHWCWFWVHSIGLSLWHTFAIKCTGFCSCSRVGALIFYQGDLWGGENPEWNVLADSWGESENQGGESFCTREHLARPIFLPPRCLLYSFIPLLPISLTLRHHSLYRSRTRSNLSLVVYENNLPPTLILVCATRHSRVDVGDSVPVSWLDRCDPGE